MYSMNKYRITEPLCRNCRYYRKPWFSSVGFCEHPDTKVWDYCVETGKVAYLYAKSARLDEKECGWGGKRFELQ